MQDMAFAVQLPASTRPIGLGPDKHGLRGGVIMQQRSPPFAMPDLKKESASIGCTGLLLGVATAAAATCSAWHSRRQKRQRPRNRVVVAQQMTDVSRLGRRFSWDHAKGTQRHARHIYQRSESEALLKEDWRDFLRELQSWGTQTSSCRSKNFQRLSSDSSEHMAERELMQQIARQRVIKEDYLNQVTQHLSNRSCPLEQLRREIACAQSRNTALAVRLMEAQEGKCRLDKKAQVLMNERDVLLRDDAELAPVVQEQHAVLLNMVDVIEGLKHCKEDDPTMCAVEELLERMERMETEEACPKLDSNQQEKLDFEEPRGSPHTSVNIDHADIWDCSPDNCEGALTTPCREYACSI